jgi:hypothetical protein
MLKVGLDKIFIRAGVGKEGADEVFTGIIVFAVVEKEVQMRFLLEL